MILQLIDGAVQDKPDIADAQLHNFGDLAVAFAVFQLQHQDFSGPRFQAVDRSNQQLIFFVVHDPVVRRIVMSGSETAVFINRYFRFDFLCPQQIQTVIADGFEQPGAGVADFAAGILLTVVFDKCHLHRILRRGGIPKHTPGEAQQR
jgi:hypothetical protein